MKNYAKVQNYLINQIRAEGYDQEPQTVQEKLLFLHTIFYKEYGWAVKMYGEHRALYEWLQGLPSAINVEYRNHAVITLNQEWGLLPADPAEKQIEKILDQWWRFVAMRIKGLWTAYRIAL